MCVKDVVIKNQVGLHARPATFFIQKANEFKSSIWVEKDDRKVNAKSLLDPGYFSTTVDVTNGSAAYDLITKLKGLQDDVNMFRGDSAGAFLETLLSDVSVDTQEVDVFCKTYTSLEASINSLRTSVSGVDEDEEGLALIKFQNAYNMASKVISVMSQMYDKLINETGVA